MSVAVSERDKTLSEIEAVEFALTCFDEYEDNEKGRRNYLRQNFEKHPELRKLVSYTVEGLMKRLEQLMDEKKHQEEREILLLEKEKQDKEILLLRLRSGQPDATEEVRHGMEQMALTGGDGSAKEAKSSAVVIRDRDFLGDYVDRKHFLDRLVQKICDWMSLDGYYHSTALINSTGMGKSRTAKEICSKIRAVYVSLSGTNVPVYYPALKRMFLSLKEDAATRTKEATRLLYCFMKAAEGLDVDTLYKSQFDEGGTLLDRVVNLRKRQKEEGDTPVKVRDVARSDSYGNPLVSFEDDRVQTTSSEKCSQLLIIIDEAMLLLDENDGNDNGENDNGNVIRTLRRVASRIKGCYLLFLSTSSAAQCLVPYPSRPPDRPYPSPECKRLSSPLFEVGDCLHSDSAVPYPFNLGRPLWVALSRLHARLQSPETTWVSYVNEVKHRLFGRVPIRSSGEISKLAAFMSRFWLRAKQSAASSLVQHHLAIVCDANVDGEGKVELASCYACEPIVAEAAAYALYDDTLSMKDVLSTINKECIQNALHCDKGEIGEVCAAALLTYSMDMIRFEELMNWNISNYHLIDRSFSSPLSLNSFLQRILRKYDNPLLAAELRAGLADFDGFQIQCTHFVRMNLEEQAHLINGDYIPQSLLHNMFVRRTAIFTKDNFKAIDLVIPIAKFDDKVRHGLVLVQVKNHANEVTDERSLLTVMRPAAILMKDVPCVCLLLAVGKGCEPYFFRGTNISHETRQAEGKQEHPRLEASLCLTDFVGLLPIEVVETFRRICALDPYIPGMDYFDDRSTTESDRLADERGGFPEESGEGNESRSNVDLILLRRIFGRFTVKGQSCITPPEAVQALKVAGLAASRRNVLGCLAIRKAANYTGFIGQYNVDWDDFYATYVAIRNSPDYRNLKV